jgi:hypothetical protein
MMNGPSFPPEMRQLAALERRLNEDLTLDEIDEIEQQITAQATDKTRQVAINLLNRFEAKKPALIDRQITLLNDASDPVAKIRLLAPLMGYLDPEAVDTQLTAIEMDVALSSNEKVRAAAQKQLEHLKFAQKKPILHDLKTFADQARKVAAAVQRTQSLQPMLAEFNPIQLTEIRRLGGRE